MSIKHYQSLVSTSDELRRQVDMGEISEPFDAIRADFQSRGRGQVGNGWESENGKNLLISVLAKPQNVDVSRQFIVSMAISLATTDTIAPLLKPEQRRMLKIKWPNDIYVGDGKMVGILAENRLSGRFIADTIIGIGLNVNQEVFTSGAPNPVSIKQLTGEENGIAALANELIINLRIRLGQVDNQEDAELMRAYWDRLYRADGQPHMFADHEGRFMATITAVAPDGRLTLTTDDGERRSYLFKEVEHVIRTESGCEVTPNL